MGQLTTEDIGKVANQTIEAALHGQRYRHSGVFEPGFEIVGRFGAFHEPGRNDRLALANGPSKKFRKKSGFTL